MALWLLSVAAAIEAATGLALIIYPQAVASLRRKCADRRPMPQISLDDSRRISDWGKVTA